MCACTGGPVFLPLGREDGVEQRVGGVGALWRPEGEHVLQDVEGKLSGKLTKQRRFGEGRPLVLKSPLTTDVPLRGREKLCILHLQ